jgi:uncharacterized protein
MQNLVQTLLAEWRSSLTRLAESVPREKGFPVLPQKIKVAIGMRRVGKTYVMLQQIQYLLQQQIPLSQILYVNFEDDRLLPCTQEKLAQLLDAFYKIYPENHDKRCYFFLDEIQNVADWSLVVRRFYDSKNVDIYLTGSSAKLLSKDIATALRGRSIASEIWPYSFSEYLKARAIALEGNLLSQKIQDVLMQQLKLYLFQGGFPETTHMDDQYRRQVLQDYVELVILRDIIERYAVKNIVLLRSLIKTVIKNMASLFSIGKFVNDAKSQGLLGSRSVVYEYLDYLEDAYLIFSVPLFSESLRRVQSNHKKMYVIDPGLAQAYSFSLNENYGHLFENIVFLDLKRQGCKIYYYLTKERYEVDFLIEDKAGKRKLYQVCWDPSDKETLAREIRALNLAKEELHLEGELITPQRYIEEAWLNRDFAQE